MKKAIVLFSLLALFCGFGSVLISAQEKSRITVRGSELNNRPEVDSPELVLPVAV